MLDFLLKRNFVTLKIFGNMQRLNGPFECICKVEYSMAVTFFEVSTIAGNGYLWARIVDIPERFKLNDNIYYNIFLVA